MRRKLVPPYFKRNQEQKQEMR